MVVFHIVISGSAVIEAHDRAEAEQMIRDHVGCYVSLINVREQGVDCDDLGWPLIKITDPTPTVGPSFPVRRIS